MVAKRGFVRTVHNRIQCVLFTLLSGSLPIDTNRGTFFTRPLPFLILESDSELFTFDKLPFGMIYVCLEEITNKIGNRNAAICVNVSSFYVTLNQWVQYLCKSQ